MNKIYYFFTLLFILCNFNILNAQKASTPNSDYDLIVLKNGDNIKANIKNIDKTSNKLSYLSIDNLSGPTIIINLSDVLLVKYANGSEEYFNINKTLNSSNNNNNNNNRGLGMLGAGIGLTSVGIIFIPVGVLAIQNFGGAVAMVTIGSASLLSGIILTSVGGVILHKQLNKQVSLNFCPINTDFSNSFAQITRNNINGFSLSSKLNFCF